MIDIHTHILPGFDDGAKDLETALQMAAAAAADGVDCVIATPHVITGAFDYSREQIAAAVADLNHELKARQIPVEILPGGEYRLEVDLPARLREGRVMTLNDSGAYLLVELPASLLPPDYERVLYDIQLQGVIPVIAHPERNQVIMRHHDILARLTERGIKAQITCASVTGSFGRQIQKCSRRLLEQDAVHFLASDAHTISGHRGVGLAEARDEIKRRYGENYARALSEDNPARLLKGRDIPALPPRSGLSWLQRMIGR
ncbi:MAG TPA: CpsB/CapC family capsule biosynthesis tyrosine phosphatase [Syntrophomonas sp.]|nr:CpsB/CapC family capsule biosynthesis tyrosine phosphatase [Syntrophomonas sp.]